VVYRTKKKEAANHNADSKVKGKDKVDTNINVYSPDVLYVGLPTL